MSRYCYAYGSTTQLHVYTTLFTDLLATPCSPAPSASPTDQLRHRAPSPSVQSPCSAPAPQQRCLKPVASAATLAKRVASTELQQQLADSELTGMGQELVRPGGGGDCGILEGMHECYHISVRIEAATHEIVIRVMPIDLACSYMRPSTSVDTADVHSSRTP